MGNPREVFLQNLLAMAATLLYRATKAMDRADNTPEQEALVIENESWFKETRVAIIRALETPDLGAATAISASPAANSGQNWNSPNRGNGIQLIKPVLPTDVDTTSAEPLSPRSSGGNLKGKRPLLPDAQALSYFLN